MKTTVLIANEYGQADVLEFLPTELGHLAADSVRVQVKAAGINPIDARRMTGEFKHGGLPQTFGTEYAGVVVEVGSEVQGWKVGDEVMGSGGAFTHATVIDVPAGNLVAKPQNLSWEVAGSIAGAAQTAMTLIDEIGPVKTLLIHGASGGVGSIAVQLAVERGIKVVATASAKNQAYLRSLGAVAVEYGAGLTERLQQVHPELFDASVDMVGSEEATEASLNTVKPDGIMGTIAGRPLSSNKIKNMWVKRNPDNLKHVVNGVAQGQFHWVVSATFPFEQAQHAYAEILNGHTKGKSVLVFSDQ